MAKQNRFKRFIAILLSVLMAASSFGVVQAAYEPLYDYAEEADILELIQTTESREEFEELFGTFFEEMFIVYDEEELLLFDADYCVDTMSAADINFARLLQLSLFAFDANMCGPDVEARSHFAWRQNCHLQDMNVTIPPDFRGTGGQTTIDVSGGFHDAGDHIKFNLPISFGMTTLGWALYEYRAEFEHANAFVHARRLLNHYACFLRRSIVWNANGTPAAFVYQVGDGEGGGGRGDAYSDHAFWGPPHEQTGTRNGARRYVYFTNLSADFPGTEQVAAAAAFLANNYVNFGNPEDLVAATALFNWARNTTPHRFARRGVSTEGGAGRNFYRSEHMEDKLALAGEWMVRATGNTAHRNGGTGLVHRNWPYTWDNHWMQVFVLREDWTNLGREFGGTGSNRVRVDQPNVYQVWDNWGNARKNTAMQGVALAYANRRGNTTTANERTTWALTQMRFLLGGGANTQRNSFVIGYPSIGGTPTVAQSEFRLHHRAAHSGTNWSSANPWRDFNHIHLTEGGHQHRGTAPANLLVGALLGGPGTRANNATGTFRNCISDYAHTEGTIDYNASLVLAAAGFMRRFPGDNPVALSTFPSFPAALRTPTCDGPNVGPVVPSVDINFRWSPSVGTDRNVANSTANDHVLVLSNLNITPCIVAANRDATLRIDYITGGNNSTRRILAWTDLSGTAANRNNITFLTPANREAGHIVRSPVVIAAGAASETLTIPRHLLFSGNNTASRIYLAITTNNEDSVAIANHRGGGADNHQEFNRFQTVTLTVTAHQEATNPIACGTCSNLPCRCVTAVQHFTVTFDPAGGERTGGGALTQSVPSGGNATLPTVARTGFNFTGWTGTHTNVTSTRTITANWTPAAGQQTLAVPAGRHAVYHLSALGLAAGTSMDDVPAIFDAGNAQTTFNVLAGGAIRVRTATTGHAGSWQGIDVVPAYFGEVFGGLQVGDEILVRLQLNEILPGFGGVIPENNGFRIESSQGREAPANNSRDISAGLPGTMPGVRGHAITQGQSITIRVPVDAEFIAQNSEVWGWCNTAGNRRRFAHGTPLCTATCCAGETGINDPARFRIAGHIEVPWTETGGDANGSGGSDFTVHDILIHRAGEGPIIVPGRTVTITDSPAGVASTATATPASAAPGTSVSLNAGTRAGFTFTSWTAAGVTIPATATATFTMPAGEGAFAVTANWTPVTTPDPPRTVNVTGGTASPASGIPGTPITVTAGTPPAGQVFSHWTSTTAGVVFGNANATPTTFNIPAGTGAVAITANFVQAPIVGDIILGPFDIVFEAQQAGPTPVWQLDMSRLTAAGAQSDSGIIRALGGPDYRPGVRRQTGAGNALTLIPGGFRFSLDQGSGRDLNIETGTGVGGTATTAARAEEDAFTPIAGRTYRLEVDVAGTGRIRLRANATGPDAGHVQYPTHGGHITVTAEVQTLTLEWTQTAGGGDIRINNPGLGSGVGAPPLEQLDITRMAIYDITPAGLSLFDESSIEAFSAADYALSPAQVPGVAPQPPIPVGESRTLPVVTLAGGGALPAGTTFTWRFAPGSALTPPTVSLTPSGATSAIQSSAAGTARVEVLIVPGTAQPVVPTGVTVSAAGGATSVTQGQTLQFSAAVVPSNAPQAVSWSIQPAVAGVTIPNGLLTVPATVPVGTTINVQASSMTAPAVFGQISVTVTAAAPVMRQINVTNVGGNGTNANHAQAAAGTPITLNAGTRTGFNFVRWDSSPAISITNATNNILASFTMPNHDVTLTAVWAPAQQAGPEPFTFNLANWLNANPTATFADLETELPYGLSMVAFNQPGDNVTGSITGTGTQRRVSVTGRTAYQSGFEIRGLQAGDTIDGIMLRPDNLQTPLPDNWVGAGDPGNRGSWGPRFDMWFFPLELPAFDPPPNLEAITGVAALHNTPDVLFAQMPFTAPLPDSVSLDPPPFVVPTRGATARIVLMRGDWGAAFDHWVGIPHPNLHVHNIIINGVRDGGGADPDCTLCQDVGCVVCNHQMAVNAARAAITWATISNSQAESAVTGNLALPTTGLHGTTVSWASANTAINNAGVVTRPAATAGNATGTLTATISRGGVTATVSFNPVVTAQVAALLAITVLSSPAGGTASANHTQAAMGTTITLTATARANYDFVNWTASPAVAITGATNLTGATFSMPDHPVTITANWISNLDPLASYRLALGTLIAEAQGVVANTQINTSAAQVPVGQFWATQQAHNAINGAIATAQTAHGLTQTTAAALISARNTLQDALTAFNGQRTAGTMTAIRTHLGDFDIVFADEDTGPVIPPSFTFSLRNFLNTAPASLTFDCLEEGTLPYGLGISVERHTYTDADNPIVDTTAVGNLVGAGTNRNIAVTQVMAGPTGLMIDGLLPGDTLSVIALQPDNLAPPAPGDEVAWSWGSWGPRFDMWYFPAEGGAPIEPHSEAFTGHLRLHDSGQHSAQTPPTSIAAFSQLPSRVLPAGHPALEHDGMQLTGTRPLVVPAGGGRARIMISRGQWGTLPAGTNLWQGIPHPNIHIHDIVITRTGTSAFSVDENQVDTMQTPVAADFRFATPLPGVAPAPPIYTNITHSLPAVVLANGTALPSGAFAEWVIVPGEGRLAAPDVNLPVSGATISSTQAGTARVSVTVVTPLAAPTPRTITVNGGTANHWTATAGTTVTVTANTPPSGQVFSGWTSSPPVGFIDATNPQTTFQMIDQNVTVTANFSADPRTAARAALWQLITQANQRTYASYTPATWTPFESARSAAAAVYANQGATLEQLNDAHGALSSAMNGLVQFGHHTVTLNTVTGVFRSPSNPAAPNIQTRGRANNTSLGTLPRAVEMTHNLGHRFGGWQNAATNEFVRDNHIVTADMTLNAVWVSQATIAATPTPRTSPFSLGDANDDGRVTSADATRIARWITTPESQRAALFPDFHPLVADIDGDGMVCSLDVVLLARWLAGHAVGHLISN